MEGTHESNSETISKRAQETRISNGNRTVRVLLGTRLQQTSRLAMPKGEKAVKVKELLGVVGGKHQTILYLL
jgi:hypothetical protein